MSRSLPLTLTQTEHSWKRFGLNTSWENRKKIFLQNGFLFLWIDILHKVSENSLSMTMCCTRLKIQNPWRRTLSSILTHCLKIRLQQKIYDNNGPKTTISWSPISFVEYFLDSRLKISFPSDTFDTINSVMAQSPSVFPGRIRETKHYSTAFQADIFSLFEIK